MPTTEALQTPTFEKVFGMTFEEFFEKNIARKMPEEVLRSFTASVQKGHIPPLLVDEFKPEFPNYAAEFLSLLDSKVVRIAPLKFDDPNRYPFPNFDFVRGRKYAHIRVRLHPCIAIESGYNLEPLQPIRDQAEVYLAKTIVGTVYFCRELVRHISERRQSISELVDILNRLFIIKTETPEAPNSE